MNHRIWIAFALMMVMCVMGATPTALCEETYFVFTDSGSDPGRCSCGESNPKSCSCSEREAGGRRTCPCATESLEEAQDIGASGADDTSVPVVDVSIISAVVSEGGAAWRDVFGEEALRMDSDTSVRALQIYLNIYRRCVGSLNQAEQQPPALIAESGVFDEATQEAVIAFQQEQSLVVTGEVDDGTKARLYEILGDLILDAQTITDVDKTPNG